MGNEFRIRQNPDNALETPAGEEADPDEAALAKKRKEMLFSEERVIHLIKIALLAGAIIYALGVVGCYFCHLILPSWMRWLTEEQVANIKEVSVTISAGVIVSLCISILMPYRHK